ncbi:MAG: SOS response-associated peptidase [Propionibacteriaceae bacterium]|jgi:putative SOS response-associated peptidase YedK|nr:SOS response-associated peptidase [Propionibacteriaceae bacterium]
MCGRFVLARANADLVPLFGVAEAADDLPGPRYNIAPSEPVTVVLDSAKAPGRRLAAARWGLVPAYYRSLAAGPTPFNARIEKLATSGLYRGAFARRRAIIPADGFYERSRAGARPSYYVTPRGGQVLALAGLYEWWREPGPAGGWLLSATIVTQPAHGAMVPIHDREPLYLAPDLWADWLDPLTPGDPGLLGAADQASAEIAADLEFRRVGPAWLSTAPGRKQDGPSLITPLSQA